VAVLLAGCGTSQKEDQGNNQGSSQRMSEATNETLVDRCADSASTGEQQEGVGNVLETLASLLGKAGVRGEVSRGEVSRGEVSNGKIAFSRNYDIHVIDGKVPMRAFSRIPRSCSKRIPSGRLMDRR
jgi:hypothetical protein